jgi:hypothetical protein
MELWNIWYDLAGQLIAACARERTGLWFIVALLSFSVRNDLWGVTSFVRGLALKVFCYDRLLDFFHSPSLAVDRLTTIWSELVLRQFPLVKVNGRALILADGLKTPKCGRKMPAVKKLHQESNNNNKPEYIFGHSFQSISILAGQEKGVFAVPLASRIHEGVVFSNRDKRSLLDKMILLFSSLPIDQPCYFVADAYYACRSIITGLTALGHHLVTRVRNNSVAYEPVLPQAASPRQRGRHKIYGPKVKLQDLFENKALMTEIPSPLLDEAKVRLKVFMQDLIWRRVGLLVRFVAVNHPLRGKIILMTTDRALSIEQIITIYAWRFKIEVSFKQALRTLGAYAYHFWMKGMKVLQRISGDQHLHRASEKYRQQVRRKIDAYHRFVQIGLIAQGLLQYLSCCHASLVWKHYGSYMRTIRPGVLPSEMVTMIAMRHLYPEFLAGKGKLRRISKLLWGLLDLSRSVGLRLVA